MNKELLEVKTIIVVIPIINNMNADLVLLQNQPYFEIDLLRQAGHQLVDINDLNRRMVGQTTDYPQVDINEKMMMVEHQEVEVMQNLQVHNDLSEVLENLGTSNIILFLAYIFSFIRWHMLLYPYR